MLYQNMFCAVKGENKTAHLIQFVDKLC